MARPKSFKEDELIALINEYYLKYPNMTIKVSDLERYANAHDTQNSNHIPFDAVQELNNISTKSTPIIR